MKNIIKSFLLLVLLCWLPSTLFAEVTYYHTDAMGTPMAMTDSTGKVVWQGDFYPFGEEYQIQATPNKNKRRFTGKEKDEESGLHYFGARYMEEASGRFISPDPVTAVDAQTSKTNTALLGNPLRLNRYVYGLNNPHLYIDPDGRMPKNIENSGFNHFELEDSGVRYGGGRYSGKSFGKALWQKITGKTYPRDYQTKRTIQRSAQFKSEGAARATAREKVGRNPVNISDNKLRSQDGKWQYRAKPVDTKNNHVHLERLNPKTGEVKVNWHLNYLKSK